MLSVGSHGRASGSRLRGNVEPRALNSDLTGCLGVGELADVHVRVEVHAAVGAGRRHVRLGAGGGGVEVGCARVAAELVEAVVAARAGGVPKAGLLTPADVLLPLRSVRNALDGRHVAGGGVALLDVDDLGREVALVIMNYDADQAVDGLPASLVIDVEDADVLGLLVQQLGDGDAKAAADVAEVAVLLVGQHGVAARPALLGVVVEVPHLVLEIGVDQLDDGRDGGLVARAAAVRQGAGHVVGLELGEVVDGVVVVGGTTVVVVEVNGDGGRGPGAAVVRASEDGARRCCSIGDGTGD